MFQVGPACYHSEAAAAAASASAQVGAVVTHGSTAYVVDVSAVSASAITYEFYPVGGGAAVQLVAPYTPQACGLLDTADGLAIGWGIALVWLAAFSLMFLTRSLRES